MTVVVYFIDHFLLILFGVVFFWLLFVKSEHNSKYRVIEGGGWKKKWKKATSKKKMASIGKSISRNPVVKPFVQAAKAVGKFSEKSGIYLAKQSRKVVDPAYRRKLARERNLKAWLKGKNEIKRQAQTDYKNNYSDYVDTYQTLVKTKNEKKNREIVKSNEISALSKSELNGKQKRHERGIKTIINQNLQQLKFMLE